MGLLPLAGDVCDLSKGGAGLQRLCCFGSRRKRLKRLWRGVGDAVPSWFIPFSSWFRTGARMQIRRTFVGFVIGMSLLACAKPVAAAGKHAGRGHVGARRVTGDTALGPLIAYPRHTDSFSSSSERYYTGGEVNAFPFRSSAEALEIVPGLAVGR